MAPINHAGKFRSIYQIILQRGQKNVGGIAENNDPQSYWKLENIDPKHNFRPSPVRCASDAVREDYKVNDEMRNHTPKREHRDVMKVTQEGARDQNHSGDHHP